MLVDKDAPNKFNKYLKIINTDLKNDINFLKVIVSETQKWHENLSRPNGSWVIDQNNKVCYLNTTHSSILK